MTLSTDIVILIANIYIATIFIIQEAAGYALAMAFLWIAVLGVMLLRYI